MTRDELKAQIDELMRQYADEEIDGATYQKKDDGINHIGSERNQRRIIINLKTKAPHHRRLSSGEEPSGVYGIMHQHRC